MSGSDARHPLQLALGLSAAGSVRAACETHGLTGTVMGIDDDLSHGPLDDGVSRASYLRECFHGAGEWEFDATDAFQPWGDLVAEVDAGTHDAVIIWSGDNVAESTFLSMTCWWLRSLDLPLLRVPMPGDDGRPYVAVHTPERLAELSGNARRLADLERADLADDFSRIRGETGLLRRWDAGRIVGIPPEAYDSMLLRVVAADWVPAARVVGSAMSRCDSHNLMSDVFFASRLQQLIDAGLVEVKGRRGQLREYAVRLADTTVAHPAVPRRRTR